MIRGRAVLSLASVACGVLACRGAGNGALPGQQEVDVYVPAPIEGGAGDDAEASTAAEAGEDGFGLGQIDRAGHPLTAVLLVPGSLDDTFNAQPSFEGNVPRVLQDAVEARLELLDTLTLGDAGPDPVDWPVPEGGAHPLLAVFVTDVLLVDTARACVGDAGFMPSYLDLEREIYLGAAAHTTCGGRTPDEAVVDETLTLLVHGQTEGGSPVTQGVPGPTQPAPLAFPYLAPPN